MGSGSPPRPGPPDSGRCVRRRRWQRGPARAGPRAPQLPRPAPRPWPRAGAQHKPPNGTGGTQGRSRAQTALREPHSDSGYRRERGRRVRLGAEGPARGRRFGALPVLPAPPARPRGEPRAAPSLSPSRPPGSHSHPARATRGPRSPVRSPPFSALRSPHRSPLPAPPPPLRRSQRAPRPALRTPGLRLPAAPRGRPPLRRLPPAPSGSRCRHCPAAAAAAAPAPPAPPVPGHGLRLLRFAVRPRGEPESRGEKGREGRSGEGKSGEGA